MSPRSPKSLNAEFTETLRVLRVKAWEAQRTRRGRAATENSRFKIQDPSLQKSLPEKQQITILYYGGSRFSCGQQWYSNKRLSEFVSQNKG